MQLCVYTEDCKSSSIDTHYTGTQSTTQFGVLCLRWDDQRLQHVEWNSILTMAGNNSEGAANHCRNPNGRPGGPWCFTFAVNRTWDYCNIAICGESKSSETGGVFVFGWKLHFITCNDEKKTIDYILSCSLINIIGTRCVWYTFHFCSIKVLMRFGVWCIIIAR